MALPREPRQKMINIMYLVLTAILALNVSNEVINAFKVVDKSLIASNGSINSANGAIYSALDAKLKDPSSQEKAKKWKPKADQAKVLSDQVYDYVEGLKLELKRSADLIMRAPKNPGEDSVQDFKEDNLNTSTRLFEVLGNGEI